MDLHAFNVLSSNLDDPRIEAQRATYHSCATELRSLMTTSALYQRPLTSRKAHPFVQKGTPEITRDKFGTGRIIDKSEFARRAIDRPSPLLEEDATAADALPLELTLALDAVSRRGHLIVADREQRLIVLRAIAARLEPLRSILNSHQCQEAKDIASTFNAAWTACTIDARRWPDKWLPYRYLKGFPTLFDIPDSGVFKEDLQLEQIDKSSFLAGNTRMVAQICKELESASRDPSQRERREACWEKTKQEIEQRLIKGPFTVRQTDRKYGRGKWRCIGRNAVMQKGKWRCIDNGKRNKANKAQRLHERIVCGRADFPVTMAREFARRELERNALQANKDAMRSIRKRRRLRMQHGTMDLKAAYRRVPTSQPEYTCVAVLNTDSDKVVICDVPGHNFGLASAVPNFNRYPELAISISRTLLWTVSEHYYDDADTAEPGWAQGTGQACLDELCGDTFHGFGFDELQTSHMKGENDYLGVTSDISTADEGFLTMDVSRKRRDKIKLLVQEVLDSGVLKSGIAASIYGKSRFMLSPCYGGLGNACLPPMAQRSKQKSATEITADAAESLEFISFACDALPPVRLPVLVQTSLPKVVVFVDAEGKQRRGPRPPSGHLGFVVYHPYHGTVHAHAPVPASIVALLDACKKRKTYIGQFELIGAITPFISLPASWFAGHPVELWIDNSGALTALVKDYSGLPDCARIVNTFHFAIARLGLASLWIDFVNSESNPADVPSRAHELYAQLGDGAIPVLAEFGRPVSMTVPSFATTDGEWLPMVDIAKSVW